MPLFRTSCHALLLFAVIQATQAKATSSPNVIIIMTDDQGYGDLGCHGNPAIKTPNLDRLHTESVRLTDFHVDPTCSPTRAALMTGRYSHRARVWHTVQGRNFLGRSEQTIGDHFKRAGYRTALFGKWHLGVNYPYRPIDRGFEEWLGQGDGGTGQANDYWGNDRFNDIYIHNGQRETEPRPGFGTDVFFDAAIDFVKAKDPRPFLLCLPTYTPHSPLHIDPAWLEDYPQLNGQLPAFFATISRIDMNIGRLRKALDNHGLADNTILVFLTDNGSSTGFKFFNAGMTGGKGNLYDGGHRVPCFIHWPEGKLAHGQDVTQLSAHLDLLPTMAGLCSVPLPNDLKLDGIDLSPLLRNPKKSWPQRTLIVESQRIAHPVINRKTSVLRDTWRLVNMNRDTTGKARYALYDLASDPAQEKDVIKSHPETAKSLTAAYETYWKSVSQGDESHLAYVIAGTPHQKTIDLCGGDWLATTNLEQTNPPVPWNPGTVLRGLRSNGYWGIEFAQAGKYRVELRRWPREVDAPIRAPLPVDKGPVDAYKGTKPARLPAGVALPITSARLTLGDKSYTKPVNDTQHTVDFEVEIQQAGTQTRLQTYMLDDQGNELCGAYYVYVELVRAQ